MKGFIKVKEWFFDKTNDACKNYNMMLVGEYDENDMLDHTTFRVENILNETEKAVQAELDAETFSGKVRTWKTWIPKSVITEMHVA